MFTKIRSWIRALFGKSQLTKPDDEFHDTTYQELFFKALAAVAGPVPKDTGKLCDYVWDLNRSYGKCSAVIEFNAAGQGRVKTRKNDLTDVGVITIGLDHLPVKAESTVDALYGPHSGFHKMGDGKVMVLVRRKSGETGVEYLVDPKNGSTSLAKQLREIESRE